MDMKFAIASYLWLIDQLHKEDSLAAHDLGIMITADEEIGGYNGVAYLLNKQGFGCDVAVIPDGGHEWRMEEFAKGIQWVKLESFGEAGHASKPWEGGTNAIPPLLDALEDIRKLVPPNPGHEDTLLSVGTIEGGEAANQLAPYASAVLDIRLANHEDYEQLFPHIEAICEHHGINADLLVSDPPCVNDPGNPYIEQFRALITETVGREPGSWYGYAAHDGRHFSAHNIPCIIVHPPAGGWHGAEEWLSTEGFAQFCQLLQKYVRQTAC